MLGVERRILGYIIREEDKRDKMRTKMRRGRWDMRKG